MRRSPRQSKAVAPYTYRSVMPGLFDAIVNTQEPPPETPHGGMPSAAVMPGMEN